MVGSTYQEDKWADGPTVGWADLPGGFSRMILMSKPERLTDKLTGGQAGGLLRFVVPGGFNRMTLMSKPGCLALM